MSDIYTWARAVLDHLIHGKDLGDMPPSLREKRAACFVTLHEKDSGALRGCIGSLSPLYTNLGEEIRHNAKQAAFHDPRFTPVSAMEWDNLSLSVDVLSPSEKIVSMEDLDPKVYGVIVSRGFARGVLLPDLEGVDTVEDQVRIAKMKAGIPSHKDAKLERFKVTRYEA